MTPAATARLWFREWRDDDLPLARALWGDPAVTALIGGPFDDAWVAARLAREQATAREHGYQYWPVFARDDDGFVGCCGLRPYQPGVLELGVHLRPAASGRGLAQEACRAVIAHAFDALGVDALFAGHHPDNAASARMLARLGFRFTHAEPYPPTGRDHPSYRLPRQP